MAEFTINAGDSLDLYVALGATIGSDQIFIQNKSDFAVYITSEAVAPTNKNDGLKLSSGEQATSSTTDLGCFANAYLTDIKIYAKVL